jgi:hypothetical protein
MWSTIITTITMAITILTASMTLEVVILEETTLEDTSTTGTRDASVVHETFKSYLMKHVIEMSEMYTICGLQDRMAHGKNK